MEPLGQTLSVAVDDSSQIAVARRAARAEALRVGLPEARADDVEIVAVELATNLLRYASGGVLLLNPFVQAKTLELLAVDTGPGMANLTACSEDGYSSGFTPGLGLGSVRRLSDGMETYSWPDKGTVIGACFAASALEAPLPGVVCTAMRGETVSGDRWAFRWAGEVALYLVVDGLGHGLHASDAAMLAVEIFLNAETKDPAMLVEQMHAAMRSTRGAALSVIAVDHESRNASYCGVGNISASVQNPTRVTHMISQNGTVGHQARQIRAFPYPFQAGELLVMHTDGVSTHWDLNKYPGLFHAAPSSVAALLHRDFNRGRDDATVLAVRL